MPSFIGRPASLENTGALIPMQLWVPQGIANELTYEKKVVAPPLDVIAQIDTGSTYTVIQAGVAAKLGLVPAGTAVITLLTTRDECRQYHVQLLFPQGTIVDVLAIEATLPGGLNVQCLIGRDVLKHSLLIYNGLINTFSLIF